MLFADRDTYQHPGPLGPALDLTRVTGVDLHHTAAGWTDDVEGNLYGIAKYTYDKFGRSSYNFAIHPADADVVYEMQGLRRGAHNDGENSTRLGLVVLGNYDQSRPSLEVVRTVGRFVRHAHESGWTTRLHVKGHRDTDATSCPGRNLYAQFPTIRTIASEEDDMTPEQEAKLDELLGLAKWLKDRTMKTNMAVGRMENTHGSGLTDIADTVFARVWGSPVGKQDYTYGQAVDRIYRKVSSMGSGAVDVDTLAAALSDQLGADLAAELGRRLTS